MRNIILLLFTVSLFACNSSKKATDDIWYQIYDGEFYDFGLPTGYVNSSGDTVVAPGKYRYIFTDTFTQMAIVYTLDNRCIGIDKDENELFQVHWYDNGPDYVRDGLFRIKKDGKIGYANEAGEIIIKPQYKCSTPFENGKAKVAVECDLVDDGEHIAMENAKWFYIDTKGKTVK